jgi:hypothetical protein
MLCKADCQTEHSQSFCSNCNIPPMSTFFNHNQQTQQLTQLPLNTQYDCSSCCQLRTTRAHQINTSKACTRYSHAPGAHVVA